VATRVILCVDCGVAFESRTSNRIRCDPCRDARQRQLEKQRNAKRTAQGHWTADTLRRKYGWTVADFQTQLEIQGGACAVCRVPTPGEGHYWHVDHDHQTGKVRGILCQHCNLGVGNAGDDPERLRAMASYLREHSSTD